jgi:hypothetical protein
VTHVAFTSPRHSRGATTTALVATAAWPADRTVLYLEADPAGGDLVSLFHLRSEPSVLTLAAVARATVEAAEIWEHTQRLPGDPGAEVLIAHVDPRQARAAVAALARAGLGTALSALDADVVSDVGRLDPDSPALDLFAAADVRAAVLRPTLNDVDHLQTRLALLSAEGIDDVHLVVVGEGRWGPEELARATGAAGVLGVMADDAKGAVALGAHGSGAKALRRSPLWRSGRKLTERILVLGAVTGAEEAEPANANGVGMADDAQLQDAQVPGALL